MYVCMKIIWKQNIKVKMIFRGPMLPGAWNHKSLRETKRLGCPPAQDSGQHQDCYISSRGSPKTWKNATVIGKGGTTLTYI